MKVGRSKLLTSSKALNHESTNSGHTASNSRKNSAELRQKIILNKPLSIIQNREKARLQICFPTLNTGPRQHLLILIQFWMIFFWGEEELNISILITPFINGKILILIYYKIHTEDIYEVSSSSKNKFS